MLRVASFPPPIAQNPYQRLLYEHLRPLGIELVEGRPPFHAVWLAQARGRVDVLHFHWPQIYWRHGDAGLLGLALSWVKLALFAMRLATARALGYRIVWTVHQTRPHEGAGAADDLGAGLLLRAANALIVHDRATLCTVEATQMGASRKAVVIPHGSFAGVYPQGRPRAEVREGLGLDQDALVFLCFGNLRRYKDVGMLAEAFRRAALTDAALVVAGAPLDAQVARELQHELGEDPRVRLLLEHVPDDGVAEVFGAADVAVLPRSDGGTSGALVLALSLGLPVIAARRPAYEELLGESTAGWLFAPGDPDSLARALSEVASARDTLRSRAHAVERIELLPWPDVAARTAIVIRGKES